MNHIMTVFNQKGGVGKTTTVVNLSAALALLGKKVLVIDIDPQANTTSGLGLDKIPEKSIYGVIKGSKKPQEVIQHTKIENLDIISSHGDVAGLEMDLAIEGNWQYRLKDALEQCPGYDYILIDSPPSLGILSLMGLIASKEILLPIQCEYYALEGVGQLFNTIQLVKENYNKDLDLNGVVMTMYDGRTNLSTQVVENVKDYFSTMVYQTTIPRNIKLAEAPSYGQDIFTYAPKSAGAKAYESLAREMVKGEAKK
ncbi:MAG: ParA family protein [Peptoniphilus sp. oral taxon 375]|nr:sporulation initiation inhibitor protein Soj [Peptoniphilus sp. oral taxon 375 str. F0436]MBS4872714.1 ParA family protein [Peptoniphilus sp. oral taxon 375]